MGKMVDIGWWDLLVGFTILVIPIFIFSFYKVKLNKDLIISVTRMIIQLFLVAVYLEWIFEQNSAWINTLWVLIMVIIGAATVVKRVALSWKHFLVPLLLAGFISIFIIDAFLLGLVIKPDYFFDARYFVPITGMVLGNSLNHNIVGLTAWFDGLSKQRELYYFLLTNSGSKRQAMLPFIQDALKKGLNPMLATMSVMGLISLPGMMTGQILGGASPGVAIKYQVMIMLAIFVGCTLTLILSILFSKKKLVDEFGNLKSFR
ncbi:ABC transporter permease [Natronoflexus pectinivorans]|uniref:Putative ABC transport system permease protein n=1 Tax=Natronoflexus pectinivorans TaxID=682526 RepID=A0A4R2GIM1_9BACT|nr:ABC transporter permease [Natronoflexus pectinivorans]TCO08235.1 putative ABC transport system permease protein [Natronoflexus pectinivorans]